LTLSGEIIVAGHVARVGGCHIIVTAQGRHGWSSFRLTVGDKAWDIGPFGYCTDALGDLVPAAPLLATPDYRAEVRFDGEPYEWRLVVDEGWNPQLRYELRQVASS
jgi:hypothetical protein